MKRMYLRRRKSKKNIIINFIAVIIILIFSLTIYILKIFNDKALPQLLSYSKIETTKIVTSIISSNVVKKISNNISIDDLIITTKDSNGKIKNIDFNTKNVNMILSDTIEIVEESLKYLENGEVDKLKLDNSLSISDDKLRKGIIYELPSGIIFNNVILNTILPKIPIKINLIGNIFCRLNTNIEDYGINNALIKVNINIEVEIKILLPFISSNSKINVDVPIIIKIIEGDVPSYYFDGYLNSRELNNK